MQARKFVAPDMRNALKMVKEALGDSAIILSNHKVGKNVEVVAVREEDFTYEDVPDVVNLVKTNQTISREIKRVEPTSAIHGYTAEMKAQLLSQLQENEQSKKEKVSLEENTQAMSKNKIEVNENKIEINESKEFSHEAVRLTVEKNHEKRSLEEENKILKEMLNNCFGMSGWGSLNFRHAALASVTKQLYQLGLSSNVMNMLVDALKEEKTESIRDIWRKSMRHLYRKVECETEDVIFKGGVFALVGPTGAGKTTTVAKLATRFVLSEGADNIALVTTDAYRVGAGEQLSLLAAMLNVPVSVITPKKSLEYCLNAYAKKKLILIDTAGLPKEDEAYLHHLNILKSVKNKVQFWSVMPANAQYPCLFKMADEWSDFPLSGVVITKTDEAAYLGEVLSVVIEKELKIKYLTNGLRIPEHIQVPDVKKLLGELVKKSENKPFDENEMLSHLTLFEKDRPGNVLIQNASQGVTA